MAAMLSAAGERGEFSGDAVCSARLVVAMTRGIAVIDRAYDDEQRLRQIAFEAIRLIIGSPR